MPIENTGKKNLIWQYHVNVVNGYYGPHRFNIAKASSSLMSMYAMKIGAEYRLVTQPQFSERRLPGGPAMERFQLLGNEYEAYDKILYIDTDILPSAEAPSIFDDYSSADIAGIHRPHPRDLEILKKGWLSKAVDHNKYIENYVNGAILLMSREFRAYLIETINIDDIQCDAGKHWDTHGIDVKWPVYDQSMVSYAIAISSFTLSRVNETFIKGPYFFNYGGQKSHSTSKEFFERYRSLRDDWLAGDTYL
ncbi:hypothetical protein VB739_11995 [Cyanobium gracile UHCC 0281]|uniref:Glycosyltransferase n=2 Tax=Cyanobium gracile TaxID=59930 RepID=A0ABU5SXT3_9CYAN|nr:hypothetical protein [Cyanobium gracile UHCC 0281]